MDAVWIFSNNDLISGCEDEQSDSLDAKQMHEIQTDFEKTFNQTDEMKFEEEEEDGGGGCGESQNKLTDVKLNNDGDDVKFSVKNLENLKMVFKKGEEENVEKSGTCVL